MMKRLSLVMMLALAAGAFAQQQVQPAQPAQPAQQQMQQQMQQMQPGMTQMGQQQAWQQQTWQIEDLQRQVDDLFNRLHEQAEEADRQDIDDLRMQFDRLIDSVLYEMSRVGQMQHDQQLMGTGDQQRFEQLEQRLEALEQQGRVQRALTRAQRDFMNLRGDILEGADRDRVGQEFTRVRGDLERAFQGVRGSAQQRWMQLQEDLGAFEQRFRAEETITDEDFDDFMRGFDFDDAFDTGAWHDRPIATQVGMDNWWREYRGYLGDVQTRLEGFGEDFAAPEFDRERIAQDLEDMRANLERLFEEQYEQFGEREAEEREWWVVFQAQWLDFAEQIRAETPTPGVAEAHATLLESLRERGLQATQQQRMQGLQQARTQLEGIRTRAQADNDLTARASEVGQVRAQLREQFWDTEGEEFIAWNRLRTQLVDLERQFREGQAADDDAWDEIFEGLEGTQMWPGTAPGTGN